MKQLIHEEKTQTTCVLRLFGAPLWTVQQAAQQADVAARCRGRGAEVLAALQAETPAGLEKARKALCSRFTAELYGEGEMTLVHAAVQALETHRRLLVCCDADAGTLLEARLETVPGAEKVFDFGALSRRGCWLRTVANTDAPALWLLDMIRRAASGLPQAAGTSWQKYGRAVPADVLTVRSLPDKPENTAPTKPPRKRHRVRKYLIVLLLLVLAVLAAAWYYTGGDLTALPQRLQSLGADSLPHAGAKLI